MRFDGRPGSYTLPRRFPMPKRQDEINITSKNTILYPDRQNENCVKLHFILKYSQKRETFYDYTVDLTQTSIGELKMELLIRWHLDDSRFDIQMTFQANGEVLDDSSPDIPLIYLSDWSHRTIVVRVIEKQSLNESFNDNVPSLGFANKFSGMLPTPDRKQASSLSNIEKKLPPGLENIGNTCFMNSALQCLIHIPQLTTYFTNKVEKSLLNKDNPLGTGGEVAKLYRQILLNLKRGFPTYTELFELKRTVSKRAPQFLNYQQQDSHEFLNYFLDTMHEDTKNNDGHSIISQLFHGKLITTVECRIPNCQKVEIIDSSFTFLPLPLDFQPTKETQMCLEACIEAFIAPEILGQNGQWLCSSCHRMTNAKKTISFDQLPPILIFQLKRFNYLRNSVTKNKRFIQYPLYDLDMTPYVKNERKTMYSLIAVCNHYGHLASGHYHTYAYNSNDKCWYDFDDRRVQRIHKRDVVTNDAYILLYMRQDVLTRTEEEINY